MRYIRSHRALELRAPSRKPLRRIALAAAVTAAIGGGIVALTGIGDAATMTGQVRAAGSAAAIPGSYVVVLKDGSVSASAVGSTASRMASRYGGNVKRSWGVALRGFEFTGSSFAARRLAADPSVAYVEQNQVYRVDDTQQDATFGLDRIDQRDLPVDGTYTFSTTASNVHAYVIDTGIRLTHEDFGGRAVSGFDFIDNDNDASDCNGHGTHVSGTIGGTTFGVAKEVQLVAVRVLDCTGAGSTASVIAGINFVTQNAIRPAVANMSLGGGISTALDDAVQNSIDSGVTYAIAAGNDGGDACAGSPGRVPDALTVGATEQNDARASFSDIGSCVDIFAPGVDITSDFLDSDTATAVLSGTSMSTPHVAGGAALFLANNPTASPAEVASALTDAATTGVVGDPGNGSPDRLLFVS